MPTAEPIVETGSLDREEVLTAPSANAPATSDVQDDRRDWRVIIYDVLGDFSEQTGAAFG